jgi:hypothetical protein
MFSPTPLPRSLEASFRDLGSDKAATRASAIRDVVRHAGHDDAARARAIPQLERVLQDDAVAEVRAEAAVALADVAAHEALPVLLVAIEDDDAHVRQMALSAIGEIGDARATSRIERALRDPRPEVRYQAVIAFARVAKDTPPVVTAALLRALDDGDSAIRYIAMRVAEERLAADGEVAGAAAIDEKAEQLVDGLDPALAVVAGIYLARLGRARGRAIVLDVVAESRSTPELEDEQACVELAGDLYIADALPHLERRAWGARRVLRSVLAWGAGDRNSCSWHAVIALARLGHERARAEILADLSSRRRERREAAVVAVGRARLSEARAVLETLGESVDAALVREALVRLAV